MLQDSPKSIGKSIRLARNKLKLTQKDVALTTGVGVRFISDLENGKATCQLGKTLKVIETLGMRLRIELPIGFESDLTHPS